MGDPVDIPSRPVGLNETGTGTLETFDDEPTSPRSTIPV